MMNLLILTANLISLATAVGAATSDAIMELPVAKYGIGSWETKGHGNHRAVLEVTEPRGSFCWSRKASP
jgi:hypothetical protein